MEESSWNEYNDDVLVNEASNNKFYERIKRDRSWCDSAIPETSETDNNNNNNSNNTPDSTAPKYQKVVITEIDDENTDPDTIFACQKLDECLKLREKWIRINECAGFSSTIKRKSVLEPVESGSKTTAEDDEIDHVKYVVLQRDTSTREYTYTYAMVDGVIVVHQFENNGQTIPSFHEFVEDFNTVSYYDYICMYISLL
jgi:hypothetical protein